MSNTTAGSLWLAADYHFPLTYSCRVPMTNMSIATASPAPGPATIRLALVRTAIEIFPMAYVRDTLFPVIRSASIRVRPPERVALSSHVLHARKESLPKPVAATTSGSAYIIGTPICREFAHANSPMTIYIDVPNAYCEAVSRTLAVIGYWGRTDSFAQCLSVGNHEPIIEECGIPLAAVDNTYPVRGFLTSLVTEFHDTQVRWEDIMPVLSQQRDAIRIDIYIWPMQLVGRYGDSRMFARRSFMPRVRRDQPERADSAHRKQLNGTRISH